MPTRAYSDLYIVDAQENLGNMFDYAVNTCHISIGETAAYFMDSGVADQFGKGNPRYVAGRTGCELLWDCGVLGRMGTCLLPMAEEYPL